jgi:hypothetical protein
MLLLQCLRVSLVTALLVLPAACHRPTLEEGGVVSRPESRRGGRWQIPRATRLPPGGVVVPLEVVGNHPFVQVRINGSGPYRLLLDTASGDLRLAPQVIEALGLPQSENVSFSRGAKPGAPDIKYVEVLGHLVQSLEIGAARFERVHAVEMEFPDFAAMLSPLDGIVGLSVFRDCLLTLDYPARQLRLGFGRLPPPDGRDVIPIEVQYPGGYAFTALKVWGRSVPFVVDSGNNGGLQMPASQARRRDFAFGPVAYPWPAVTAYGAEESQVGRLRRDVRVGRHTLASPVVDLTITHSGPFQEMANLGGAVLRHFAVTFDQKSQAMRLARTEPGPVEFAPVRAAGFSCLPHPNGWLVDTAAAATSLDQPGLRKGDRIVAIDGRPLPADGPTFGALLPADSARFTVERDGDRGAERFDLTLSVTTLVP